MSTVIKDLGAVSAYAYAVEKGYTGTEAEFAELMADYAEVGQRAEDAADSALESKTAAQTAATTATNKATEATTAATTATNKAAEAQADADAAALDASQALSAASTATTKATEATTAAATATSAKTDAVAANTAAQSAKTAAQTAQTGAETAAASVEASAEQIATNAEDISQLKSEITALAPKEDMLKAFPTDTASGSVASFADGANVPVKSLIVDINPVQSGSGDPSPDNVRPISGWSEVNVQRTGKNLFDEANATIYKRYFQAVTGGYIWSSISDSSSYAFKCQPNTTYTLKPNNPNVNIFRVATINVSIEESENATLNQVSTTEIPRTITTDADATYIVIQANNLIASVKKTQLQIELGESATEFEPYQQIQSLNITLGQTVYGGKLDVLSGELTVYPYYASYNGETLTGEWISDRDKYVSGTTPTIGAQVINIGAQGVTVQLEPHEVESLYGVNNLWADSGDTEVVYRADTKLFIERLTAPDSADMIADANITSGQYFMVGNSLYKATANIANGAQIIVGTNCIRKSLSEALNEINS